MENTPTLKHYIELPFSIIMLATAPILIRYSGIHFLALIGWRLFFVSLGLFIISILFKSKISFKKSYLKIGGVSFILLLHFVTWIIAIRNLPVSVATISYACHPITTAILAKFILKEKYHKRYLVGLVFSMIGMYLVSQTKNNNMEVTSIGLISVGFSALFYSLYMVLSKKVRSGLNNIQYSFFLNLFGMIMTFFVIANLNFLGITHIESINYPLDEWKVIITLALFSSLMGHTLLLYLVHYFNLNLISIIKLASPIMSSIFAYILFKEQLTYIHGLAFTFILFGLVISSNLGEFYAKRLRTRK